VNTFYVPGITGTLHSFFLLKQPYVRGGNIHILKHARGVRELPKVMHLLWSKAGERFLDCRLPSLHSFHHAVAYPPGLAIAWITCPGMGHCSLSDDRRTLIFISESLFFDLVPFL
jgi:hypothetical protein